MPVKVTAAERNKRVVQLVKRIHPADHGRDDPNPAEAVRAIQTFYDPLKQAAFDWTDDWGLGVVYEQGTKLPRIVADRAEWIVMVGGGKGKRTILKQGGMELGELHEAVERVLAPHKQLRDQPTVWDRLDGDDFEDL